MVALFFDSKEEEKIVEEIKKKKNPYCLFVAMGGVQDRKNL